VGFTVSRKFGCAVQRNRIRRRLREAVRRSFPQLLPFAVDAVALPRAGVQTAAFAELLGDVARLVRHLQERPV